MALHTEQKKQVPAYVSYKSFRDFVGSLENGVEEQVDRVVWDSRFGHKSSSQLLTALRFLGLITASNRPTGILHELAAAVGEAKLTVLARVLEAQYTAVLDALAELSRGAFEQVFHEAYGTRGDTTRRCMAFLLHAAMDARLDIADEILQGERLPLSIARPASTRLRTGENAEDGSAMKPVKPHSGGARAAFPGAEELAQMDPVLLGMMVSLPKPGPLSDESKRVWKHAFDAVFELVYPTHHGRAGYLDHAS